MKDAVRRWSGTQFSCATAKVNNAQSASGFTEMMEQLKELAQKQGSLNGQMQGLNLLPGGAQGDAAKQQSRVLARQQRDVAKTLADVSDADQTGRTDALAKEAQTLAQQMERSGIARVWPLDCIAACSMPVAFSSRTNAMIGTAGGEVGQCPRPRGRRSAGQGGNKFAPPTWNELRGLGPEERRLVIEYFRRLNGSTP
jgi:hypothetical protein